MCAERANGGPCVPSGRARRVREREARAARRDRGEKLRLYAEAGVTEYWIVDPAARTFEFLDNRDGAFSLRLPDEGVYRSAAVAGLELDVEAFWRELPEPPAG